MNRTREDLAAQPQAKGVKAYRLLLEDLLQDADYLSAVEEQAFGQIA